MRLSYTPSERPGEWVCPECTPPRGQRVSDRAKHDAWHSLQALADTLPGPG